MIKPVGMLLKIIIWHLFGDYPGTSISPAIQAILASLHFMKVFEGMNWNKTEVAEGRLLIMKILQKPSEFKGI